jgi:hypothetical protein
MSKTDYAAVIAHIDATTDYDADTVILHRNGTISAKLDANKTCNGPHDAFLLIGHVDDFTA